MARNVILALALFGPAVAQAHPGAHLHPHGAESAFTLVGIAVLVAAGAWLILRAR